MIPFIVYTCFRLDSSKPINFVCYICNYQQLKIQQSRKMDFPHSKQEQTIKDQIIQKQDQNNQQARSSDVRQGVDQYNLSKQLKKNHKNKNRLEPASKERRRIKSETWNNIEIKKIFKLYEEYGSQWKIMETQFVDRVANSIKNRFYTVIRTLLKIMFRQHPSIIQKLPHEIPSKSILKFYQGRDEFAKFRGFGKRVLKNINYDLECPQIKQIVSENGLEILALYEVIFDIKILQEGNSQVRKLIGKKTKSEGYIQKLVNYEDISQKIKTPKSTPVDLHKARTQANESRMEQYQPNNPQNLNQGMIFFLPVPTFFELPTVYPVYRFY